MKRALVISLFILLTLAVAIQFVRPDRTNPRVVAPIAFGDPSVERIFRRSCFDCHSHETRWPWYSSFAPISWLVVYDIKEAREHMNFSNWTESDADIYEEICEEVEEGKMPLRKYVLLHPDARLSEPDRKAICDWADRQERAIERRGRDH